MSYHIPKYKHKAPFFLKIGFKMWGHLKFEDDKSLDLFIYLFVWREY